MPLGIRTSTFTGSAAATVLFVVGWLLLVPAAVIMFGPSREDEMEQFGELQGTAERLGRKRGIGEGATGEATRPAPVDELGDRDAHGDVDEAAFERRLDGLLETEDVSADDATPVERAVEHPDATDRAGSGDLHLPRE